MDIKRIKDGSIEVICGCMFAGKTEELIRRIHRIEYAKKTVIVFKPTIDNRYSETEIVSHSKYSCKAYRVKTVNDCIKILSKFETLPYAVCFDEVQFFGEEFINYFSELALNGVRVICAGLDQDFRGLPFGIMGSLLCMADEVTKLSAICVKCGSVGTKTQRLINGEPAKFDDPLVLIGEKESYEARCKFCHEVKY